MSSTCHRSIIGKGKASDQRQMITVTTVVAIAFIGAKRHDTAILHILFEQKRRTVYATTFKPLCHFLRCENVVDSLPMPFELIGSRHVCRPFRLLTHIHQLSVGVISARRIIGLIVEIASHKDGCIGLSVTNGIDDGHKPSGNSQPIGRRSILSAKTAGGMYHENMKGIARSDAPRSITPNSSESPLIFLLGPSHIQSICKPP